MLANLIQDPILLIYYIIALVIAITFHEAAHATATTFLGDQTAKNNDRLNLNPLKHLDPLGSLLIFIAGFGWGKPVPFNPNFVKYGKWGIALIGVSGPLTNFIIAFIFGLILKTGLLSPSIMALLLIIVQINIVIGILNLIPVPPLDGSKILQAFLPESKQDLIYQIEKRGSLILLAIIFADIIFNLGIIRTIVGPIYTFILGLIL